MKKLFSLLFCSLAICASAQVSTSVSSSVSSSVYYLIPTAEKSAADFVVADTAQYLPLEDGYQPEREAFAWFASRYAATQVVTIKDIEDGKLLTDGSLGNVKVLWMNISRVGLTLEQFDAMYNSTFRANLKAFVEAGGNLFLSSQATRFVADMGRSKWWPNDYKYDNYAKCPVEDVWYITFQFCNGTDNGTHAVYKYMTDVAQLDGIDAHYPIYADTVRTDNNNAWGDFDLYWRETGHDPETEEAPKGCDIARQTCFESAQNCKILGGWGHTRGLDYAGFVEFPATDTFKGTVITMGLAAYQWTKGNTKIYNIQNLTAGILDYLTPADATPTTIVEQTSIGENEIFDILGRRVSAATANGLYIINGHKVLVSK